MLWLSVHIFTSWKLHVDLLEFLTQTFYLIAFIAIEWIMIYDTEPSHKLFIQNSLHNSTLAMEGRRICSLILHRIFSTHLFWRTSSIASCMSVAPGLKKFGYTTLESIRPSEMFRPRELQTSSYSPINIILVIASVGTCTYCVQMLLTIKILSSPKICVIVVVKMVYYSNTTTVWRHPKDARYIGF